MLTKTWASRLKGAWPTQGAPSPPMAICPSVVLPLISVIAWQPMPGMAR